MTGPLWTPTEWLLSQTAHLGWGAFVVLALALWRAPRRGWLVLAAWTLAREAVFDPLVEGDPLLWGGVTDAAFYALGGALGHGVYAAALARGRVVTRPPGRSKPCGA